MNRKPMDQPMDHCLTWEDRLEESALTGHVPLHVEKHLLSCEGCRSFLAGQKLLCQQMERGVRELVTTDGPASDLYPQVMQRVAARPFRAFRWPVWAGTAALCVSVLALVSMLPRPKPPDTRTVNSQIATLSTWHSPTDMLLRPLTAGVLLIPPRIGEMYFPMQPVAANKKHQKRRDQ